MTTRTTLRGIAGIPDTVSIYDAPQKVLFKNNDPALFVNPIGKTVGEAMSEVLAKDIAMTKAYYGDPDGSLTKAENLLFGLTKSGENLHNRTLDFGIISDSFAPLANRIKRLSKLTQPSFVGKNIGIGNQEFVRQEMLFIQSELRPITTKTAYDNKILFLQNRINNSNFVLKPLRQSAYNRVVGAIDSFIKPGGGKDSMHHALYRFLPTSQSNVTATLAAKTLNHKIQAEQLAQVLSLDIELFDYMSDVGIKGKNLSGGVGPLTASETIDALRLGGTDLESITQAKIGFLDPGTVALVVKIGGIILGILTAAQSFVAELKDNPDTLATTLNNQFGTASNQPLVQDWDNPQNSESTSFTEDVNPLLIGGLVLSGLAIYQITK